MLVVEPQRDEVFARLLRQLDLKKTAHRSRVFQSLAALLRGQSALQDLRGLREDGFLGGGALVAFQHLLLQPL